MNGRSTRGDTRWMLWSVNSSGLVVAAAHASVLCEGNNLYEAFTASPEPFDLGSTCSCSSVIICPHFSATFQLSPMCPALSQHLHTLVTTPDIPGTLGTVPDSLLTAVTHCQLNLYPVQILIVVLTVTCQGGLHA